MTLKELLKVIEIDTPVQIEDLRKMHSYSFDMTIEIPKKYHKRKVESVIPYNNRLAIMVY